MRSLKTFSDRSVKCMHANVTFDFPERSMDTRERKLSMLLSGKSKFTFACGLVGYLFWVGHPGMSFLHSAAWPRPQM